MVFRESLTGIVVWTILRFWVGWQWLSIGWEKVFGPGREVWIGSKAGVAVTSFIRGALEKMDGANSDVQPWYGWILNNLALPNAKILSYIVSYGEVLLGLALISGFLTAPALLTGIFMNLNYLLAGTISINPILMSAAAILLFIGPAAYYVGLDRWIIPEISRRWGRRRRMKLI